MASDDYEAKFQEDRRQALAAGPEALWKHKQQYPGVYRFSGLPWKDYEHREHS